MKANNGSGNIELRDEWETPQILWDKLNKQYNFSFDCCASDNNHKCQRFTGVFELIPELPFVCWMNPPFSKAKEMFEHFFKVVKRGVAIYRFDNPETKLWQIIYDKADWIFVFNKRINYEGMKGKGSRFPSALVGVGVPPPLLDRGTILIKQSVGKSDEYLQTL